MKPKKNWNYPAVTEGSRYAREIRARANHLSSEERQRHLRNGLNKIYASGGTTNSERRRNTT